MFKWKDVTSPKLFGLTAKIKQKYGIEELIKFYLSKCSQKFEEMKNDYENGYGLKYISKNNNINLRWVKKIFEYNNVKLRTQKERMEIFNSKILPELLIKKYGVTNVFQLDTVKQKSKNTKKDLYGDENFNNREKCKQTIDEKYGYDNIFQVPEIQEKIKETIKEKYGVEYISQTDFFKDKCEKTIIEKYGNKEQYYNERYELYKQTCLAKYNCENYFQCEDFIKSNFTDELIQKRKDSMIKNGHWNFDYENNLDELKSYTKMVRSLTKKVYRKYKNIINPNNLKISKNDYNLDHKRSIYDCYYDGLLPEQCANVNNLIVITSQENLTKNKHSSITKEELLFLIENNKM